ncbi:DUF5103 domain-containing protein [Flavobacteriaceae bacterium]|nr:DUF5103 domain-containing protein [Flavobacteriaceae bacterium]
MKALKTCPAFFLSLFSSLLAHTQVLNEITNVAFIKSISFKSETGKHQFPLITKGENFTLQFDDLLAEDNDYYYVIEYFDHDWKPSSLYKNEYLSGLDNLRISNHKSSYGTLQRYTHYKLTLPNENTQFLVSGNYMISVLDANDELMFRRKFLIYEELASIEAGVFRSRELEQFSTHQTVQFSVNPIGINIRNPNNDLKIILLQNEQWDNAKKLSKPQYIIGQELHFRYDLPAQFEGGNEFFHFDTKDNRITNPSISYVEQEDLYQTYLFTDPERANYPYTFNPDINGDFVINTVLGEDPDTEADYTQVHFSLAKQYTLRDEEIFLYGKFSNYELNENYRLIYNPSYEVYERTLLLKQGFYNYKYVWKTEEGLEKNKISGTHAITENQYLILLYIWDVGNQYDALIGVKTLSSFGIKN